MVDENLNQSIDAYNCEIDFEITVELADTSETVKLYDIIKKHNGEDGYMVKFNDKHLY